MDTEAVFRDGVSLSVERKIKSDPAHFTIMKSYYLIFFLGLALHITSVFAQEPNRALVNGVPWFDDQVQIVNAHGACVVEEEGKYYLFGEFKTDSTNHFIGFSCYSSSDLVHWKFERLALPKQEEGLLGPGRIGERAKVMRCPQSGEYIMLMHCDDLQYKDPYIGYAVSNTINGEYRFQGPLLYQGKPIKKWDMGTFQDHDGQGYLLVHHGDIYRLSADYKEAEEKVVSQISGVGESPAMFKKEGIYYLLSSNLTSWERNDNHYHTAGSIAGPWKKQGLFCPAGSLTYNSQCSFVFPIVQQQDTVLMYMGDRWSYPKQGQAATQVWLPLETDGEQLRITSYLYTWDPLGNKSRVIRKRSIPLPARKPFLSNSKGEKVEFPFKGGRFYIKGESDRHGGYARIVIADKKGLVLHHVMVDFYSKVPDHGIRFVSPRLPQGEYTIKVEVSGEQGLWYKKDGTGFGSDDYYVRVDEIGYVD